MPYVIFDRIDVERSEPHENPAAYPPLAKAAVAAFGGKYIVAHSNPEVLEGNWEPQRLTILEFESAEIARKWWGSAENQAAMAARSPGHVYKTVLIP